VAAEKSCQKIKMIGAPERIRTSDLCLRRA